MYNGIGLQTARGSGTNGHVQRNFAVLRRRDKRDFKDEKKADQANRKPNQEILEHARKRKVEVKCIEYMDSLEDQGLSQEEIESKVEVFRRILLLTEKSLQEEKLQRDVVQETHHIAEANLQKNAHLREAFGISEFFTDGSSFDPERKEREAQLKAAMQKNYELIRSPSSEEEVDKSTETKKDEKSSLLWKKEKETSDKKRKSKHHSKRDEKHKKSKKSKKKVNMSESSSSSRSSSPRSGKSNNETTSEMVSENNLAILSRLLTKKKRSKSISSDSSDDVVQKKKSKRTKRNKSKKI